jgi:hypothetical protein
MTSRYGARSWARRTALVGLGAALWTGAAMLNARAADPVKIGFSVSLTGGLASSGKAHLLSKQIWAEEVNAKSGLLGRPVQLVYYNDQTNASTVPGIYAKLMDIDMPFLQFGRKIHGVIQGESHPGDFIPRLVDYLMDGKMPIERIVTFYDLADINQAAVDSAKGTTIKPLIRMPR